MRAQSKRNYSQLNFCTGAHRGYGWARKQKSPPTPTPLIQASATPTPTSTNHQTRAQATHDGIKQQQPQI